MPPPRQIQPRSKRFGTVSRRRCGFTLIELLTVILLIAILSAISLRLVDTVQERQREGRAKSDLDALGLALEQFMLSNSTYPEYHADNKHLSDYNDTRGFPDEKKSSEALFLTLAGWHNERGDELDLKGDADAGGGRPKGYLNLSDFELGSDGSRSNLREQMQNLASDKPDKPKKIYFIDPWRQPYLYKFPILPDQTKPQIRRRMDYVLLSKGPDKEISSSDSKKYGEDTWLSSEGAGLDKSDSNDQNIDNLIQGPSPSG